MSQDMSVMAHMHCFLVIHTAAKILHVRPGDQCALLCCMCTLAWRQASDGTCSFGREGACHTHSLAALPDCESQPDI